MTETVIAFRNFFDGDIGAANQAIPSLTGEQPAKLWLMLVIRVAEAGDAPWAEFQDLFVHKHAV